MEILLRIVDRSAREDDAKRGDVVEIHPDGWSWSQRELTNPDWRIVRAPILPTLADALLSQLGRQQANPSPRRRDWTVDVTKLGLDGPRNQAIVERTQAQVISAASKKP